MREIDLAIVGDIAWNQDITPQRKSVSPGGGAYYSAVGAAYCSDKVGIVGKVGEDYDLKLLERRNVDTQGISVVGGGQTCKFTITQFPDNTRVFEAKRGVSETVDTGIFPNNYLSAQYIHLSTQLPAHTLTWLDFLAGHRGVSVDSFESFVSEYPELTVAMFKRAGLIFANEEEVKILNQFGNTIVDKPTIIKRGDKGASYVDSGVTINVPAPKVKVTETTGAGDVLAGIFLALRAQSVPVSIALEQAVNIASFSVTEFGVEHIPTKEFMNKDPELITATLVLNKKNEIFLGKAPKFNDSWIVPGGHFNEGETPEECAAREVKEEVGVEISGLTFLKTHESFAPEYKGRGARFLCHNFFARISGGKVALAKDEYSDYVFIDPVQALRLPGLHPTARSIIEYYLETQHK